MEERAGAEAEGEQCPEQAGFQTGGMTLRVRTLVQKEIDEWNTD